MSVNVIIFTDCAHWIFTRYAGAYKIATVLREAGYTVQVIDHFLFSGRERVEKILEKFVGSDTLMVGFSTTFMNPSTEFTELTKRDQSMFRMKELSTISLGTSTVHGFSEGLPIADHEVDRIRDKIKSINPNTKLVMGGTKADFCNQSQIDAFVIGFSDLSIVDYLRFLQGKNPSFQYKIINENQMLIDNDITADGYDFVNSKIRFDDSDLIRKNEVLPIEIARGCVFKCKFCYYPLIGRKKNDYTKTVEVLYDEFMYNYERFGTTKYIFADDTFNESVQKLEYLKQVHDRLPFKLEYCTYVRLDLIHRFPEMADLLKESGLRICMFGIETLNHEAGKCIGKGLHPEKTKETLYWLRNEKEWKNNILMTSGFIIGLPTETHESVSNWAEDLLSGSYPLDSFNFHGLRLSPDDSRVWKSEFEKNYADYGYYFDSSRSSGWINDYWRSEDATDLATRIHDYATAAGLTKLHGHLGLMMQNYNLTWDDILTLSWPEVSHRAFFNKTHTMADEYLNNILKL